MNVFFALSYITGKRFYWPRVASTFIFDWKSGERKLKTALIHIWNTFGRLVPFPWNCVKVFNVLTPQTLLKNVEFSGSMMWNSRGESASSNVRNLRLCSPYTGCCFLCRHEKLSVIVWPPIRYVTLHCRDWRGAASLRYRNRAEITVLMCEQKPYPVWFSCRRCKCYPVKCEQSLSLVTVNRLDVKNNLISMCNQMVTSEIRE